MACLFGSEDDEQKEPEKKEPEKKESTNKNKIDEAKRSIGAFYLKLQALHLPQGAYIVFLKSFGNIYAKSFTEDLSKPLDATTTVANSPLKVVLSLPDSNIKIASCLPIGTRKREGSVFIGMQGTRTFQIPSFFASENEGQNNLLSTVFLLLSFLPPFALPSFLRRCPLLIALTLPR
jgi:hypothetical protein